MTEETKPKALRGFAAIKAKNPELQKEMARRGGASVAPQNRSFAKNRELAVESGRKGGSVGKREA